MGRFFKVNKFVIKTIVLIMFICSLRVPIFASELAQIPYSVGNKYQLEEAMIIATDRLANEFTVNAAGMTNDDLRSYSIVDNQLLSERLNGYKMVKPRASGNEVVITLYYKTMYEASMAYKDPNTYERKISREAREALENAKSVISRKITPDMNDFTKEKVIHDYIVENTTYTKGSLEGRKATESIFGVQGVLCNKVAVCQGYAETMKLFMDMLGIDCYVVTGTANANKQTVAHAWNLVNLDNEWYHVDTTWDDTDQENQKVYTYFNLTDDEIMKDHRADSNRRYPEANGKKYAYDAMNIACTYEEFSQKINELLQKGVSEGNCLWQ